MFNSPLHDRMPRSIRPGRANSGMGKETGQELARMGSEVILGCRSSQLGGAARREVIGTTGSSAVT
jgi:hypothetical protein